jgi:AcrR family transcriptional regulator
MEPRTPSDYFEEGLRLLARGGARAVTITNLCDGLGVTKGSFYHHFASGPAFLDALLRYWEREYADRLVASALEVEDPQERLAVLTEMAASLHHEAENAIRALARSEPFAAEVLHRVDDGRMRVTARSLREAGFSEADATRFATMSLALLVGAQQIAATPDRRAVLSVLQAPYDLLVATLAQPAS